MLPKLDVDKLKRPVNTRKASNSSRFPPTIESPTESIGSTTSSKPKKPKSASSFASSSSSALPPIPTSALAAPPPRSSASGIALAAAPRSRVLAARAASSEEYEEAGPGLVAAPRAAAPRAAAASSSEEEGEDEYPGLSAAAAASLSEVAVADLRELSRLGITLEDNYPEYIERVSELINRYKNVDDVSAENQIERIRSILDEIIGKISLLRDTSHGFNRIIFDMRRLCYNIPHTKTELNRRLKNIYKLLNEYDDNESNMIDTYVAMCLELRHEKTPFPEIFGSVSYNHRDKVVNCRNGEVSILTLLTEIRHDLLGEPGSDTVEEYIKYYIKNNLSISDLRPLSENEYIQFVIRCVEEFDCGIFGYKEETDIFLTNSIDQLAPIRTICPIPISNKDNNCIFGDASSQAQKIAGGLRLTRETCVYPDPVFSRLDAGSGGDQRGNTSTEADFKSRVDKKIEGIAGISVVFDTIDNIKIIITRRSSDIFNIQIRDIGSGTRYYNQDVDLKQSNSKIDIPRCESITRIVMTAFFNTFEPESVIEEVTRIGRSSKQTSSSSSRKISEDPIDILERYMAELTNPRLRMTDEQRENRKRALNVFLACKSLKSCMDRLYDIDRFLTAILNPDLTVLFTGGDYAKIYMMLLTYDEAASNFITDLRLNTNPKCSTCTPDEKFGGIVSGIRGNQYRMLFSTLEKKNQDIFKLLDYKDLVTNVNKAISLYESLEQNVSEFQKTSRITPTGETNRLTIRNIFTDINDPDRDVTIDDLESLKKEFTGYSKQFKRYRNMEGHVITVEEARVTISDFIDRKISQLDNRSRSIEQFAVCDQLWKELDNKAIPFNNEAFSLAIRRRVNMVCSAGATSSSSSSSAAPAAPAAPAPINYGSSSSSSSAAMASAAASRPQLTEVTIEIDKYPPDDSVLTPNDIAKIHAEIRECIKQYGVHGIMSYANDIAEYINIWTKIINPPDLHDPQVKPSVSPIKGDILNENELKLKRKRYQFKYNLLMTYIYPHRGGQKIYRKNVTYRSHKKSKKPKKINKYYKTAKKHHRCVTRCRHKKAKKCYKMTKKYKYNI
jgi:hypothetical protein